MDSGDLTPISGMLTGDGPRIVQDSDPGDEQPTSPELKLIAGAGGTSELDTTSLLQDLHSWVISSMQTAQVLYEHAPSRELAISITKLEEAEMWLVKLYPTEEVTSA